MSEREMTIAEAYAIALVEAIKRTNENRAKSQAVLGPKKPIPTN